MTTVISAASGNEPHNASSSTGSVRNRLPLQMKLPVSWARLDRCGLLHAISTPSRRENLDLGRPAHHGRQRVAPMAVGPVLPLVVGDDRTRQISATFRVSRAWSNTAMRQR